MKLTSFTDYSLRVLIYLAVEPDRRATIAEIAQAFDISTNHLTKVVHFLGKNGWLANVRGKGGGLELGRPPQAIVIGNVVRETEGEAVVVECFGEEGGNCAITPVCQLRHVLVEAVEAFYNVLDHYTLADMVSNRKALARRLLLVHPPKSLRARQAL
jgi:Rrf2 family transcriptional regulator, nitric oxide-sensitive transcriptional repressor